MELINDGVKQWCWNCNTKLIKVLGPQNPDVIPDIKYIVPFQHANSMLHLYLVIFED